MCFMLYCNRVFCFYSMLNPNRVLYLRQLQIPHDQCLLLGNRFGRATMSILIGMTLLNHGKRHRVSPFLTTLFVVVEIPLLDVGVGNDDERHRGLEAREKQHLALVVCSPKFVCVELVFPIHIEIIIGTADESFLWIEALDRSSKGGLTRTTGSTENQNVFHHGNILNSF